MMNEKVLPETLLQLMLNVLAKADSFQYISGIQPFLMSLKGRKYYVYVKNLSSAYFKDRPDTTRAQLPIKDEFSEIKESAYPFIFLGYDRINDVLICWNFHIAKKRLNERKSVSFYSRTFFQEEVSPGELLRKRLKNDDEPVFFKRKDLLMFFENIDSFFENSSPKAQVITHTPSIENGKITTISDVKLLEKLRPLLAIDTPHTLEAIKVVQAHYGDSPEMKFRDWANLVKAVKFDQEKTIDTVNCELIRLPSTKQ